MKKLEAKIILKKLVLKQLFLHLNCMKKVVKIL